MIGLQGFTLAMASARLESTVEDSQDVFAMMSLPPGSVLALTRCTNMPLARDTSPCLVVVVSV